jgi:TPR repeat protein
MTEEEFRELSEKANNRDVASMFRLGLLYTQGCYVDRYPEESVYWFKKVQERCPSYYTGDVKRLVYGY